MSDLPEHPDQTTEPADRRLSRPMRRHHRAARGPVRRHQRGARRPVLGRRRRRGTAGLALTLAGVSLAGAVGAVAVHGGGGVLRGVFGAAADRLTTAGDPFMDRTSTGDDASTGDPSASPDTDDRPDGTALSAEKPGAAAGAAAGTQGQDDEHAWVENTLAGLGLEQRVGQMFMGYVFGISGSDRDPAVVAANQRVSGVDTAAEAVSRLGLGGVIYFDAGGAGPGALPDNIVARDQVRALSTDLTEAAPVPLLIAVDQEQNIVLRIRDGVTLLPGQMAQGATGRPDDARDAAKITGADLRALGINVNFAPDADVNSDPANPVIGERSFGDDPATVARYTAAAVRGYRTAGVAAAAKHFPGHGATAVDSHLDLPVVGRSREQLDEIDLPPFRAAIDADVPMVMVGHLSVPALDDAEPAPLSAPVVDGLLRDELGFDGVVVTDALNMAAITKRYSPGEAAVKAVRAGVDLLLMPPNLVEARDALLHAVRAGDLPASRIDESVRRILRMKWGLTHVERDEPSGADQAAGIAADIARRATTLLDQATCDLLPLRPGAAVTVEGAAPASARLVEELISRGVRAELVEYAGPGRGSEPRPAAARDGAPARIVVLGNVAPPVTDRRTVVVSIGTPYRAPSNAGAWIVTYSRDLASLRALATVLAGAAEPTGRLPVTTRSPAGDPLPRGFGLTALRTC